MKYKELHNRFVKAGWKYHHAVGSTIFMRKTESFQSQYHTMVLKNRKEVCK